jgi:intein/homing endonuclease
MDVRYCKRKRKQEEYTIHPLIRPILESTYGVMVFQEQVMQILHVVGNIPLIHCEKVRKAISKKKLEQFIKYKEMFVVNGQKNLSESKKFVEDLWAQIEAFAEYGFNKCLHEDSIIFDSKSGIPHTIKEMYEKKDSNKFCVDSIDHNHKLVESKVKDIFYSGRKVVYRITTRTGRTIDSTMDHRYSTIVGWKKLKELGVGSYIALPNRMKCPEKKYGIDDRELIVLAGLITEGNLCHPSCLYFYNNNEKYIDDFVQACDVFENTSVSIKPRKNGSRYDVCVTRDINRKLIAWNSQQYYEDANKSGAYLWAKGLSLLGKTANQKELPNFVYKLSQRQLALMIGRMWAGDGFVCNHKQFTPYYASSSEKLAKQMQDLLLRLGIISVLHKKQFKYRGVYKKGFTANIVGSSIKNFISLIGPNIITKEDQVTRLKDYIKHDEYHIDALPVEIIDVIKKESKAQGVTLADVARRSGLSPRIFYTNNKKRLFYRGTINKVADVLKSKHLKEIANSDTIWDEIVSVEKIGLRNTYDLSIEKTHNFVANGIVTHNSHSCAYTYISARQLYLKSHFPLEFYTAVLMCETDDAKIKEIKIDAHKHKIDLMPVNISKSKENFTIDEDGKIYFGFEKIKGIGKEIAKRIVEHQPYKSFQDFLDRFGTDVKVVKPLIALNVFDEIYDRLTLYKFYEFYKKLHSARYQRDRRFNESMKKYDEQLKEMLDTYAFELEPEVFARANAFNEEAYLTWQETCANITLEQQYTYKGENRIRIVTLLSRLVELRRRRDKVIRERGEREKENTEEDKMVNIDQFDPSTIKLDKKDKNGKDKIDINLFLGDTKMAERQFYGFQWTHELEECEDYEGLTIDKFMEGVESAGLLCGCIEAKVTNVISKVSKTGNNYYSVMVEDANSRSCYITIWNEDFERFKEEFVKGKLLKIRVKPPSGGFSSFGFESPAKKDRWRLPKNKEEDYRVAVMKPRKVVIGEV